MSGNVGSLQYSWRVTDLSTLSLLKKIQLEERDLPQGQRERLREAFSSVLNDSKVKPLLDAQRGGEIKFDFDIHERNGFLFRAGGQWRRIVSFSEMIKGGNSFSKLYREIVAADRFAKRKGVGAQQKVFGEREKWIAGIRKPAAATRTLDRLYYKPRFQEYHAMAIDGQSFVRNTLSSVAAIPGLSASAAVNIAKVTTVSALLGGVMAVGQGLLIANSAWKAGKAAYRQGDKEGMGQAAAIGATGLSYSWVGSSMVINCAAGYAGKAALATASMTALGVGGIAMQTAFGIYAAYGWYQTREFRGELKEILKEPDEGKRYAESLAWIEEQVSLTDFEAMEIRGKAKSPEDADKEVEKAIQSKWNRFERRTSEATGQLIRSKLGRFEELKGKLRTGDLTVLNEAKEIVYEVEKANYKARASYKFCMLISIVGMIGFALLFAFPALMPVAFAIGAIIWLTIDSKDANEYVTERAWKKHLEKVDPDRYKAVYGTPNP